MQIPSLPALLPVSTCAARLSSLSSHKRPYSSELVVPKASSGSWTLGTAAGVPQANQEHEEKKGGDRKVPGGERLRRHRMSR